MSGIGDPSPNAFFFTIDGADGTQYDAHFDVNDFSGFSVGDVRYKPVKAAPGTSWIYLGPDGDSEFNEKNMLTKEATNAEIDRVFDLYTKAIDKAFGAQPTEAPEKGIERVRWIVKNGMTESNNVLTRVK